jgi:hypothetical protein
LYGFGGCKYVVITGLFIGLPIGSVLGVLLTKKLILKDGRPFILRTIISLILGLGGVVLGFYLLDVLGSQYLIIIPITVVILVLCGYHFNTKPKTRY